MIQHSTSGQERRSRHQLLLHPRLPLPPLLSKNLLRPLTTITTPPTPLLSTEQATEPILLARLTTIRTIKRVHLSQRHHITRTNSTARRLAHSPTRTLHGITTNQPPSPAALNPLRRLQPQLLPLPPATQASSRTPSSPNPSAPSRTPCSRGRHTRPAGGRPGRRRRTSRRCPRICAPPPSSRARRARRSRRLPRVRTRPTTPATRPPSQRDDPTGAAFPPRLSFELRLP